MDCLSSFLSDPQNPIELAEIVYMLTTQNYESNKITFVNADSFTIYADENMDWSLDGEISGRM